MVRLGIALGYVVVAALLVAGTFVSGSSAFAGFALIAFGIASLAFGYAFFHYAPWRCWNCVTQNPAAASACASCGTTRVESDRLAADVEEQ